MAFLLLGDFNVTRKRPLGRWRYRERNPSGVQRAPDYISALHPRRKPTDKGLVTIYGPGGVPVLVHGIDAIEICAAPGSIYTLEP